MILLIGIFFISTVSANGLMLNNSFINSTKLYNQTLYKNITITNSEPMTFYNITLQQNKYVIMSKISKLTTGQSVTIPIKINTTDNVNTNLTLFGYYFATLGEHNNTYNIVVNPSGISKCSVSATIGSKIKWTNPQLISTEKYRIVNSKTGNLIHILLSNSTWIQTLDKVGKIPFHIVDRTGFSGRDCLITVLSDTGYVNDPKYNAQLNININVKYPLSTIQTDFLSTKYNMSFSDTKEDIFSIRNTGNTIAKDITLSGDWFTFSSNHFDLSSGQQKNIGYTIKPIIQYSNQTGKIYNKQILVKGNFQQVTQPININIKYANIVNHTSSTNVTSLKDYICKNFPQFCKPQIVYKYVSKGDEKVNVSFTQNQVRDLYRLFFNFSDAQAIREKQSIAYKNSNNETLTKMQKSIQETNNNINKLQTSISNSNNVWLFTGFMLVLLTMGGLVLVLIFKYKSINGINEWTKYT